MSLTVKISPELEPLLKEEAGKAGVDPAAYTLQLLRAALPAQKPEAQCMSAEQSALLRQINEGPAAEQLDRYRELVQKRQGETITRDEFAELQNMTQRLEALQAQRMEGLAKLAKLRSISLSELMRQLEIKPPEIL